MWVQWCYCCVGELHFGPHRILSTTGVQQGWVVYFFSSAPRFFVPSSCSWWFVFPTWYLDDGILVGTPTALSSFLDVLQLQSPSYGLHPNLSKCEVLCPSGDQSFMDVGGIDFDLGFSLISFYLCGFSCWPCVCFANTPSRSWRSSGWIISAV